MSFADVLEELPMFSAQQRQLLIRRAVELDEPPLCESDESIISARLAAHRRDPGSSVPLGEFKARVRRRQRR
jgi:hypothetical protein